RVHLVEHAAEVVGEGGERVGPGVVWRLAARVATSVVAHHTVPVAKRAGLRKEVARAAAEAVREDDRRAGALDLDVQAWRRQWSCFCASSMPASTPAGLLSS